jgi:4-nitrophenyl phosphatase
MAFDPHGIRGMILDMDGVIWRGDEPLGDLPAIFDRLSALSISVILASNNASVSIAQFQDKLKQFGVRLQPDQIISSTVVAAWYLAQRFPAGGPIYGVGENGMLNTLKDYGFYQSEDRDVLAVVVGLDRDFTYQKLTKAADLVRNGAPFIGTNPDPTFPHPGTLLPGAGAILAAIAAAAEVKPLILGKPEAAMFEVCLERLGTKPETTLMVGDRIDTDIAGAQAIGIKTALVLSGVSTYEEAQAWLPPIDWIGPDLHTLVYETFN